ncbi:hypothetical protein OG871_07400 [Kitasatospora sp. NBC_00374]|uniref:hypothetical protein n=1 Tax=Kitasatospora sp. NBC_00374 TaxID=2975964 RepID=UPI0030E5381A
MIRSGAFAALCVALAACAHVSMTPAELPSRWLALAFAGVMACSWLAAGRRRGPLAVTGWMLAVQGALHQLFDGVQQTPGLQAGKPDWVALLLCEAGPVRGRIDPEELARAAGLDPSAVPATLQGMPEMAGMSGMTGMTHTTPVAHLGSALGDGLSTAHPASVGMVAAHILAALACALLFCRGDAAVAGVGRLLLALAGIVAPLVLRPTAVRAPLVRRRPYERHRPAAEPVLLHVVVRRGPPRPVSL